MKKETRFKLLFEEYYAPLCLYAKRYIDDLNVRKDLVSEVFMAVWEKLDEDLMDENTIAAYLQRAVKNQCLNHLKHQAYEWDYAEWMQKKARSYATSPDHLYTRNELYELLFHVIRQMPKEQRRVFIECFVQKKTQVEVAAEMNVSVKTIHRYKEKIVATLKEQLKDYLIILILLHCLPNIK
ncbi:MAG: RNA polymerase sigma-70 factor [Prevotellaceae bacterium]|nr:RNA polymerase sigma-70 factor [Prevotellaceae bacterium]MDY3365448.1 RNA polymerase sigma-70 factor [Prevotella sp.]